MTREEFITAASTLAMFAHNAIKQVRKGSLQPYWTHTQAVASYVAKVTDDKEMIAAAHLHDVIEDVTPEGLIMLASECEALGLDPMERLWKYDIITIRHLFGERVAGLVIELTNVYVKDAYPKLNRDARHALERARLSLVSDDAKVIKLADLLHNSEDVQSLGAFGRKWLGEKEELLPLIVNYTDPRNMFLYGACSMSVHQNKKLFEKNDSLSRNRTSG